MILLSTQEHGSAGNWAPLRAGVHSGASCFRQLITDTGDVSSWTVSAGAQAGVWDGPLVSQQGRGGGLSSQSGHKGPSRDQSCLRELTSLRRRTAPTLSSGISGPKAAESVMLKFPLLTTWSSIRDRGWALWGPCPGGSPGSFPPQVLPSHPYSLCTCAGRPLTRHVSPGPSRERRSEG